MLGSEWMHYGKDGWLYVFGSRQTRPIDYSSQVRPPSPGFEPMTSDSWQNISCPSLDHYITPLVTFTDPVHMVCYNLHMICCKLVFGFEDNYIPHVWRNCRSQTMDLYKNLKYFITFLVFVVWMYHNSISQYWLLPYIWYVSNIYKYYLLQLSVHVFRYVTVLWSYQFQHRIRISGTQTSIVFFKFT